MSLDKINTRCNICGAITVSSLPYILSTRPALFGEIHNDKAIKKVRANDVRLSKRRITSQSR